MAAHARRAVSPEQAGGAGAAAAALGACIVERHFTLDKTLPGTDHKASLVPEEFDELARLVFRRQPAGELYSRNLFTRRLFDWYYIRLGIRVRPCRILWWDRGDFSCLPHEVEAAHVE